MGSRSQRRTQENNKGLIFISISLIVFLLCTKNTSKEVSRILITESINENSENAPKLSWILSYPNSGEDQLITLLQLSTNTNTASNRGHIMQNKYGRNERGMYASVSVYSNRPNGPFLFTHHLPMPTTYLPVLTYCGAHCTECHPADFLLERNKFIAKCVASIRFTPEIALRGPTGDGVFERTQYDSSLIKRALVFMRNPFQVVFERFTFQSFHFERYHYNNHGWNKKFPINIHGFRSYCRRHEKDHLQDLTFFSQSQKILFQGVPCYIEFVKWIRWYNLTFQMLSFLEKPYEVVYYEDLHKDKDRQKLFDFFRLKQINSIAIYNSASTHTCFTTGQIAAIEEIVRYYCNDELWHYIKRYFPTSLI